MSSSHKKSLLFLSSLVIWLGNLTLAQSTLPEPNTRTAGSMDYNGQTFWLTSREMEQLYRATKIQNEILESQIKTEQLKSIVAFQKEILKKINEQKKINDNLQQEINSLRIELQDESNINLGDEILFLTGDLKNPNEENTLKIQIPDQLKPQSETILMAIQKVRKEIDVLIKKGKTEAAKIVFYDERELDSISKEMQKEAYIYINDEVEFYKASILPKK